MLQAFPTDLQGMAGKGLEVGMRPGQGGGASLEIKITPGGKGEDLLRFMKMNGQGHLGGLGD